MVLDHTQERCRMNVDCQYAGRYLAGKTGAGEEGGARGEKANLGGRRLRAHRPQQGRVHSHHDVIHSNRNSRKYIRLSGLSPTFGMQSCETYTHSSHPFSDLAAGLLSLQIFNRFPQSPV